MKTDDLVAMLATGVAPVTQNAAKWPLRLALAVGVSTAFAILLLGYGVRSDLMQAMALPMFWLKLAFPLCIAIFALLAVQRLARPGVPLGRTAWGLVVPVLVMLALATAAWWDTPAPQRWPSLMGESWRSCALSISLMALPIFAAVLAAIKTLAPTRPGWAGAAAGALAGGLGAAVYALHCVEMAAPFLALWYLLGMLVPALVGSSVGPRWLRW